jgi:hypothetical protein
VVRSTAGGNQCSYQLLIDWNKRNASPFVGWFSGDGVAQAIDAAIKAAREVGCKLPVRSITVLATERQRGEA